MFRQKFQQFMMGRYGLDQLNKFLTIVALLLSLIGSLFNLRVLSTLATAMLIWVMYRMYSRNIQARYQENLKFMPYWQKMSSYFHGMQQRWRDRKTHRYFTCPQCKQTLRVPKGKGKIKISCPRCHNNLIRKT